MHRELHRRLQKLEQASLRAYTAFVIEVQGEDGAQGHRQVFRPVCRGGRLTIEARREPLRD